MDSLLFIGYQFSWVQVNHEFKYSMNIIISHINILYIINQGFYYLQSNCIVIVYVNSMPINVLFPYTCILYMTLVGRPFFGNKIYLIYFQQALYSRSGKTTKSNIHEYTIFQQSTKIDTHENK